MPRYKVMVDDNFHYQDTDERREHGVYETVDEALAECRRLVDRYLEDNYKPSMSAEELFEHYKAFGEDPFIIVIDGPDGGADFSAWDYAKERSGVICAGGLGP